jgi:siroheme synthase
MTLVIMMGVLTLPQVSAALIEAGMDSNTPVACIENGGLPGERTLSSPLRRIADVARKAGLMPPAIIVVGEVTALRPPAVHD